MKSILTMAVILSCYPLYSQIKFDYNWILGYPSGIDSSMNSRFNGTWIDFNQTPLQYNYFKIPVELLANAIISDSNGHLLFYSNGCEVINREHKIMKNGEGLNQGGLAFIQECQSSIYEYGYSTFQGVMILPYPEAPHFYLISHLRKPDTLSRTFIQDILFSIVDIKEDNGLGSVVSKNNLIAHDTFCDMLTSVRHGNGRDWWIIVPRFNNAEYYVFLLSPQGVSAPFVQKMGYPINHATWGIQSVFSPNGKKYANHSPRGGLQIFDFDRCTGTLSNPIHITFSNDTVNASGVGFSSTSRFLYASTSTKLYQFDLKSADIPKSKQLVGVYDGFEAPLPTTFYQMQLAPDNKIYMSCTNGIPYWHIIHQPDKIGMDCDLEQHFQLPTSNAYTLPNFPHFRLFDAHDSPCDTLGINGPPPPEDTTPPPPQCSGNIRIYPNPAQHLARIELPDCEGGSLRVFDAMGRWVEDLALAPESVGTELDVSRYVPGIYFLHIRTATGEAVVRGLAVVR